MVTPPADFDWDDLRYFLAVARSGSLTGAAQALRVNHSTVYRRIGGFEAAVGARLFERLPRGYALTAAGEELREIAARIEDDVLTIGRRVMGRDTELRGSVRLTSVDELIALLAPRLHEFHRRYPGIVLDVLGEQRLVSLSRREADVALRPGGRPDEPEIVARRLCGVGYALYASRGYVAAHGAPPTSGDISAHALVTLDERLAPMRLHRGLMERTERPRVVLRSNNVVGLHAAARAGFGVAPLPCFLGDPSPDLVRVGELAGADDAALWLLYHADLRQTARVRAFIDFLSDTVRAEADLMEGRADTA